MASRKIDDCVASLQVAWMYTKKKYAELYPTDPQPFLTCTWRSNEEQQILYGMNKNHKDDDGDGKIDESDEWRSNSKPGHSKHNKYPSEAFDISFKLGSKLYWDEKLFKKFADIIKTQGVKWGGEFKSRPDTPHFEV